jgi:dihydroorotate dehydrogenase
MYKLIRSIFFLLDAEKAHYVAMNGLRFICKLPFGKKLITVLFTPKNIEPFTIFNLIFKNKIGLGAGFDKNAKYLNELEALGFGFVEIGTVTPKPQTGNEKPRLFRLKKDKALINRMGFNNDGVEAVVERLKKWEMKEREMGNGKWRVGNAKREIESGELAYGNGSSESNNCQLSIVNYQLIIGGNIGKNKNTPNETAWQDYLICFEALHPYVDYFVVNVSSPNTPGLRELQEKDSLQLIFSKLETRNSELINRKPILLKIAPDLSKEQIDDVIDLVLEIKIDGLVVSNTTLDRTNLSAEGLTKSETYGMGGLSGKPLSKKSTDLIDYIHKKSNGHIPIIGSGGIFTMQDAKEKYMAGASLLQVWTGFIYEGPGIIRQLANKSN